jgi:hypothetical protein
MRIGIVGTGHMGRTLGIRWAPSMATSVAARAGGDTRAGDSAAAADFGETLSVHVVRVVR